MKATAPITMHMTMAPIRKPVKNMGLSSLRQHRNNHHQPQHVLSFHFQMLIQYESIRKTLLYGKPSYTDTCNPYNEPPQPHRWSATVPICHIIQNMVCCCSLNTDDSICADKTNFQPTLLILFHQSISSSCLSDHSSNVS